jgi:predicted transcriptional regulator
MKRFNGPFSSKMKTYIDIRASRPYFVYKVASRKLAKKWKRIVEKYTHNEVFYPFILQGLFAGEGNVKFSISHHSRVVRIAQGKRNSFLEKALNIIGVSFRYSKSEKAYAISGRKNLEKLAEIEMEVLHPIKKEKFRKMLASYKQYHYPKHHIKRKIYKMLKKPCTSKKLAEIFRRSQARIQEILKKLKDEGTILNFKVRSGMFWIRKDQNIILISNVKKEYLGLLKKGVQTTIDLAKKRNVDFKSAYRRLRELERLRLVKQNPNKEWELCAANKEVISLTEGQQTAAGVDEAGRELNVSLTRPEVPS